MSIALNIKVAATIVEANTLVILDSRRRRLYGEDLQSETDVDPAVICLLRIDCKDRNLAYPYNLARFEDDLDTLGELTISSFYVLNSHMMLSKEKLRGVATPRRGENVNPAVASTVSSPVVHEEPYHVEPEVFSVNADGEDDHDAKRNYFFARKFDLSNYCSSALSPWLIKSSRLHILPGPSTAIIGINRLSIFMRIDSTTAVISCLRRFVPNCV